MDKLLQARVAVATGAAQGLAGAVMLRGSRGDM